MHDDMMQEVERQSQQLKDVVSDQLADANFSEAEKTELQETLTVQKDVLECLEGPFVDYVGPPLADWPE